MRVLIVEDEPLIAMDLESTVLGAVAAEVVVAASVAAARRAMRDALDLALLDINVVDGQTFEIARELKRQDVTVAFVTAFRRELLPPEFQGLPFVAKPYQQDEIEQLLREGTGEGAMRSD